MKLSKCYETYLTMEELEELELDLSLIEDRAFIEYLTEKSYLLANE
jgi:hypothetical protein